MSGRLAKFRALPGSSRLLLVESALWLAAFRVGLLVLPFRLLRRLARYPGVSTAEPRLVKTQAPEDVRGIAWAVPVAASVFPLAMTCLVQAMAADVMLRRRGHRPELRIGVTGRATRGAIEAHAWVELDGSVVVGKLSDLQAYTVLASPGPR